MPKDVTQILMEMKQEINDLIAEGNQLQGRHDRLMEELLDKTGTKTKKQAIKWLEEHQKELNKIRSSFDKSLQRFRNEYFPRG